MNRLAHGVWVVVLVASGCALPQAVPAPAVVKRAAFDTVFVLRVGESAAFDDGLTVALTRVDDSRCRGDVQCVWAGELAPVLRVHGGALPGAEEVRLGTALARQRVVGPYKLLLQSATPGSATLVAGRAAGSGDLIRMRSPQPYQVVTSPLKVTGDARGVWFFEATFPVTLLDANGKVIVQSYAQAIGNWMTPNFVPFAATLTFARPATATGTLLLQRTNPSGDPRRDDSRSIPVRFAP